ncbi:MAG: type II secretion system F family protein [Pseudomonadota bacterium]|nr:type II secretion system F family protein [Pseudomonadota bacterium]
MDNIFEFLNYMNEADYHSLILILVFITAVLITVGIALWIMASEHPVERRLRENTEDWKLHSHEPHKEGVFNVSWVEPIVKVMLPTEDWKLSKLKTRLVHAGHMGPNAIKTFIALKILLAMIVPLILVLPLILFGVILITETSKAIPALVLAGLVGYYMPDLVVYQQKKKRQLLFIEGFPDAMDMMVVCVEAGLAVDAAIARVAKEIGTSHPELAKEFYLVNLELRAGKTRQQALRDLGERTGVAQVQSLTALLIQAEHFGTSIATALRDHAEEMRTDRMQTAKEKAAKLPVKLLFPLVFFIFPALFLVVLAPAAIRIYQGFNL